MLWFMSKQASIIRTVRGEGSDGVNREDDAEKFLGNGIIVDDDAVILVNPITA